MSENQVPHRYHYLRDVHGRPYRVGESDRDILGYRRIWVLVAAWVAMLAVSALQYGYGALAPALARTHGWELGVVLWGLGIWGACQAATVLLLVVSRGKQRAAPRTATLAGATLCASALAGLGLSDSLLVLLLGYGVAGGLGAGLVYGSCVGVVSSWYPERPARAAVVSGAFSYGAVPFVLMIGNVAATEVVLRLTAVTVLVLVAGCAPLLRDAPRHWWPATIDPQAWAIDRATNPSLRRNRVAVRVHSVTELLRCRTTRWMFLLVACVSTVAMFDLAYLTIFAQQQGLSSAAGIAGIALLAVSAGLVRSPAVEVGQRFGRKRTMSMSLAACAAAQLALLSAGAHSSVALLLAGAGVAGLSSGACYALLPSFVDGYFGDQPGLPNFSVIYSAKAAGAVLGAGVSGAAVLPEGLAIGFGVGAVLCLAGVVSVRALRRPGLPRGLLPAVPPARHSLALKA